MSDKYLTRSTTTLSDNKSAKGPHAVIRHGSVSVPIYAGTTGGKTRYTIAFHLDGRRQRRMFTDIDKAKSEAKLAAEKIQRGLANNNDLTSRERELFHAARKLLSPLGTPLVAAIEEYVLARKVLGDTPLVTAATEFKRQNEGVTIGKTVPQVFQELLVAKKQDGVSKGYLIQLKAILGKFSQAVSGPILHVKSEQIDKWLRESSKCTTTRNSRLQIVRTLFSFAKQRNYLPKSDTTEAERIAKVKAVAKDTEIFTPEQFETIIRAADLRLIPMLALGAFTGVRASELGRLNWSAVNFERRVIELRATQAKTASRRIIPISENLAAWLAPFATEGRIVPKMRIRRYATELARQLEVGWPKNVLRHSYISYRVALTGDAPRIALESGNSPAVIFSHYHEMVDVEAAKAWFGIMPPDDWAERVAGTPRPENAG